jgi:hypothetical protein
MSGKGNARPRRRHRSHAEQMYWDQLSPRERVAFTLGLSVGQGHDFPPLAIVDHLRRQLGDDRAFVCTTCGRPLPPHRPGALGRPPKRCTACRTGRPATGDAA